MHELFTDFKKGYDSFSSVVLLGVSATLRNVPYVRHICLYVHLHGGNRLPMGECSSILIFEYFSKICLENSIFI